MTTTNPPPVKGAGAWKNPAWYGRGMPLPVDAAGRRRARLAMTGIQRVLIDQGHLPPPAGQLDGGAGPTTERAIRSLQRQWGLPTTGRFARTEAFCLWFPIIVWWQVALEIPGNLLCGMVALESGYDPGAQGVVDPRDRGVGQFSSRWWPNVSDEMAFGDPAACIALTGHNLQAAYAELGSWDCAVAAHNNPTKARAWRDAGEAPDEQIARYVRLVKAAASRPL